MKKEPTYIWVVERAWNGQPYKPVWMEYTREEARNWVAEEIEKDVKYRVRKYVPEQSNW